MTISEEETKKVILTCAQPTGKLTLGNYLGAVRNWATMLENHECYFGIVDLHAITTPANPATLRQNVFDCVAQYIACGLDPDKCHQFVQSHVIGHTELAWVLTCLTPIGGGGLISGMAVVAAAAEHPIEVIGVEAELFPSMYNRINGTDMPCAGDTLAEGIAVKEQGAITSRMVGALVDDIVLVSERSLEQAVSLLLQIEKTVVEGAGAAGLAALLQHPERFAGKTVGVVLCGGNIDTRLLANVLLRDLARSGRLARLRIRLQDQPGALFNVARIFDAERVNIIEIYHQRVFTTLPAKGLITDVECETRGRAHLDRLIAALRVGGYEVSTVELA